jgi:NAD(P)-dependent dehydrogenase (short-subunit alcohol dehydrogenase family)
MNRRLAVISGCSSGFGLLSTVELARRGYFVVATMRDLSRRQQLDAALASSGVSESVSVRRLDVTETASHAEFAAGIAAEYGRIDVLVNNAGFAFAGFAEDVSLDELRRQMETNFFGAVSLTQAVLPVMRRQRSGRILMLSSVGGRSAAPGLSSYAASKFALEGYTESLCQELRPLGIDCVLIEPGSFETGIWYHADNLAARASDPASPNLERSRRFRSYVQHTLKRNDAHEVARLIASLADHPRPRLRYVAGRDAKLTLILRSLLPWRTFERIVAGVLKLDSQ